jgi:hypothetical protein
MTTSSSNRSPICNSRDQFDEVLTGAIGQVQAAAHTPHVPVRHADCSIGRGIPYLMAKRSPAKQPSPAEELHITDEWGMADPAKAGMPALFKRLGHPVLHAAQSTPRRERRRGLRPERPPDGVGLAIAEARRRAEQEAKPKVEAIGQSPARAMREAMRALAEVEAQANAPTRIDSDATPIEAKTSQPTPAGPPVPASAPAARKTRGAARRAEGMARRAARPAEPAAPTPRVALPPPPAAPTQPPATVARTARPAPAPEPERPRGRRFVNVKARPVPARPAPPTPSPRRPRGVVPLSAWAHAVSDAAKTEPRRVDPLGFWRPWFRIPPEVALVEYARGCHIHRLLIEASADRISDYL